MIGAARNHIMAHRRNIERMPRPWTPADDAELARLYAMMPAIEVCPLMGRSKSSIKNRIVTLGLKKPGNSGRFKPGVATWNKGMKGLDIGGKATRFQAGRAPQLAHNYKPIGSVRLSKDGYLERKVSDDLSVYPARRWVAVHRLVWEAAYGTAPESCIVVFRPGMRTTKEAEITIDRVECITRKENMMRNTVHNLPKPLAQLVQLKGALNRQINKRSKTA
jgi:hypothetical protein